jgi:hypothetical protein
VAGPNIRVIVYQETMEADTEPTFAEIPPGWIVCSCLNCKSVIIASSAGPSDPLVCRCEEKIFIPQTQFTDRLFADDEGAKDRILSIDLTAWDEFITYPAGDVDWELARKKLLFLQTALRWDIPWGIVLPLTRPYFGQTLESPPISGVEPFTPTPFTPPPFDISRQTPEDWGRSFDEALEAYRKRTVLEIKEWRKKLIEEGALKERQRPRRSSGIAGQKKSPIPDEREVFTWAVVYFFSSEITWTQLAEYFPPPNAPRQPAPVASKANRKRAHHIMTRVTALLQELGLALR